MIVPGLLVCPALGEPFSGGVPGTPCSLCLACEEEAVQMASRGRAFAHSVVA